MSAHRPALAAMLGTRIDIERLISMTTDDAELMTTVRSNLTAAMKARNSLEVATLRSIIAAVQEAQVSGAEASTLTDEQTEQVIKAQAKRRVEAAEAFDAGNRPEKAATERAELEILERYLPEQLDEAVLTEIVDRVIQEGGYTNMKDMGPTMNAVNSEVAGRADGRMVADLVKSRLG